MPFRTDGRRNLFGSQGKVRSQDSTQGRRDGDHQVRIGRPHSAQQTQGTLSSTGRRLQTPSALSLKEIVGVSSRNGSGSTPRYIMPETRDKAQRRPESKSSGRGVFRSGLDRRSKFPRLGRSHLPRLRGEGCEHRTSALGKAGETPVTFGPRQRVAPVVEHDNLATAHQKAPFAAIAVIESASR